MTEWLSVVDRAVRLVSDLADLDDPAEFAVVALPRLADLVGCDLVTYNEIGRSPPRVRYVDYPAGMLAPATRAVFTAHLHEHPLVNHYRSSGDGRPVMISDFLTHRQFHALGLYAEFFSKVPVEHQLAVVLSEPGPEVVGVAFNRVGRDFTDADRELLALLRRPLMRALQRTRERHQANTVLATAVPTQRAALTDREVQVLELVSLGRTNGAIARALGVSPRTVAKHLEHAYRKLEVTSRTAAVLGARQRPDRWPGARAEGAS